MKPKGYLMNKYSKAIQKMLFDFEKQLPELFSAFDLGEITENEFDEAGDEIRWLEGHLRIKMEYEIAA
jgi:hypothetical protein